MLRPNTRCFAGLWVLFLLGSGARAADAWPVPRGPSREPAPYRYDPEQWKSVPKNFLDDASACVLYSGLCYLVDEDGTVESVNHEVTRLASRKAIESLGEYKGISFDPGFEKLTLNEARVHKPDGRTVPVEPKHVQLRDQSTDYQIYDRDKQLIISFPNLEVGDVIEVRWTVRGRNPEHQGNFFTRYTFGDDNYPVVRDELFVRLPKTKPLKHATVGGKVEPTITEEGNQRLYHWRVANRPQLPRETDAPSKEESRIQVAFSTFQSWDQVFQWKQQLRKECWVCTEEVRKVVAEATKGLTTPEEKARALTYWVRRHVRYISAGETHHFTPHLPGVVLGNRYGDCKDSSQLLAVMLREAGVPVNLVTLGVLDDGQVLEAVPSPWGTHAILLVTLDGKDHWIDTTVNNCAWDYLPRDDRGRACYLVDEKRLRLARTPAMRPEDNRIEQVTRMTVGADGSSRSERTATYHGAAAVSRRRDWFEVPQGDRRRVLTAELQDANNRTRLLDIQPDEASLRDFDQPVQARMTFEIPGHFAGKVVKDGSLTDSPIWSRLLAYTLDYDRAVPLDLGQPFELVHRYVVQIPPYFKLDGVPTGMAIRSKWGSFRLTARADGDDPRQIELEYHTRIEDPRVDPADFEEFRKFHESIGKGYRAWLGFRPSHDQEEKNLLEAMLALVPGDAGAAAILADLFLEKEDQASARRVLRRARHYSPGDVGLAELAVEAASGPAEEEEIYRELRRRYPDEARYAVQIGRALVEQGKHAEARKVLLPLVDNGPPEQRSLAQYQLARSSWQQGKSKQALDHLAKAEAIDPESVHTAAALVFKARIQEKLKKTKEATTTYQAALKVDRESHDALEALVRLELAGGKADAALVYLRRYSIAVHDAAGLARAADFNLRIGRLEDAFDLATRAQADGGHVLALRALGLVHHRRGEPEKAVNLLGRVDLDAEVLTALIETTLALGQLREATQWAEKADQVEANPALTKLCGTVLALAQRRKAVASQAKIAADKVDVGGPAVDRLVCAEHALAEGRTAAKVDEMLKPAFVDGVPIGPAYALRGQLLLERGRLSAALADADRAVALDPDAPRGWYVRGRGRLERGEKEALADLTKAAELSQRQDPSVLHWLAGALVRDGKKAEALAVQREAVKLKPDDVEMAEQLRELEKGAQ